MVVGGKGVGRRVERGEGVRRSLSGRELEPQTPRSRVQ